MMLGLIPLTASYSRPQFRMTRGVMLSKKTSLILASSFASRRPSSVAMLRVKLRLATLMLLNNGPALMLLGPSSPTGSRPDAGSRCPAARAIRRGAPPRHSWRGCGWPHHQRVDVKNRVLGVPREVPMLCLRPSPSPPSPHPHAGAVPSIRAVSCPPTDHLDRSGDLVDPGSCAPEDLPLRCGIEPTER